MVGESVYAIGNPLGELTYSLTDGLVSALIHRGVHRDAHAGGQIGGVELLRRHGLAVVGVQHGLDLGPVL